MLAVLDYAQIPRCGFLGRIARRIRRDNRLMTNEIKILGAPVLHIVLQIEQDISPRALNRRLSEVRRVLFTCGRAEVSFTHNFPYADFFLENGYPQPDLTRLYDSVAAQISENFVQEGATAYFSALRLSNACRDTITALCGRCRYLLADVASGGDDLFRDIQRKLGISVVEKPTPEQFSTANAAVFFGAVRQSVKLSDNCVVYAVNGEALCGVQYKKLVTGLDIALPQVKDCEILPGFPRQAIVANALNNMTLAADEVTLRAFTVSQTGFFRLDKARFV